ncbi:MAG: hypothetical protein ISR83_01235 [Candidatus Marinimicrobia bacterium]|nr:hypothetical protein [Candidatus Neomarinimicrobiota bacterium]
MLIYIVYTILSPIFWLFLHLAKWFFPKISEHLQDQNQSVENALIRIQNESKGRTIVLFHGASAGEFEQIKPLLQRIDRSKYFCIQSFTSPTIYSKEKDNPLADAVCYFPFDLPWAVQGFYKMLKPDYMVITRHDLWPHMIRLSQMHGIKLFFINANIHENSLWVKPWIKPLSRYLFSFFHSITTSSLRLKSCIEAITSNEKVIVTGDTRFDRIIDRKELKKDSINLNDSENNVIIFGSLDEIDLPIVRDSIQVHYSNGDSSLLDYNHKLIIVPHECDEDTLAVFEKAFSSINISAIRYSNYDIKQNFSCIIVDKVGILADLYAYADLAYIGAGFGRGVHSVIEPAVYGCAIAHGPKIHNLDEAVSMTQLGLSTTVKSARELANFYRLLDQPDILKTIQEKTEQFITQHKSCSQSLLNILFSK